MNISRFNWSKAALTLLALVLLVAVPAVAAENEKKGAEKVGTVVVEKTEVTKTEEAAGPPIPFHTTEGYGGILIVPTAYLVNPAPEGKIFGMPAASFIFLNIGKGRHLEAYNVSMTLWDRVELSFSLNRLDIDDLCHDINAALQRQEYMGSPAGDSDIHLLHFNARFAVLKEGEYDIPWLPAVTTGIHYKYNCDIDHLDHDLGNLLESIEIEHNSGVDFTLTASKTLKFLPRPVIVTAGLRSSEAAQTGLLGFTDDRRVFFEGSVAVLITDNLIAAFEYRQKSSRYDRIPSLIEEEDDWWTIDVAYIFDEHLTMTAGYVHMGDVLNHRANGAWGLRAKYEF